MSSSVEGNELRLTSSSLLILPDRSSPCRYLPGLFVSKIHRNIIGLRAGERVDIAVAVMDKDSCLGRQHIVRVRTGRGSPAFSLVSEFRPVRGRARKCPVVRPCCRRRCRQAAMRVRAVEWALAGVLTGLGSGMVRGPYAGPATRAGRDPARNLNEWPPGLARRGPRPGEVGKAHGADRPHFRASVPANSLPMPRRRPGVRRAGASGFWENEINGKDRHAASPSASRSTPGSSGPQPSKPGPRSPRARSPDTSPSTPPRAPKPPPAPSTTG